MVKQERKGDGKWYVPSIGLKHLAYTQAHRTNLQLESLAITVGQIKQVENDGLGRKFAMR